jgi:quercetin dioxygenase-like cupin family protein
MTAYFHDTHSAARFSPEKMTKVNLYESPRMFCDIYCLERGQSQKDHDHAANDKVYHVLTGRPTVRIGEETRELEPGFVAVAPAGIIHGVRNDHDEPATMLVFMAPHPRLHA